jgi:transglutaminase-like putative cysteine protease
MVAAIQIGIGVALVAGFLAQSGSAPKPDLGIGGAKQLAFSDKPDGKKVAFRRSEPDDPYLEKLRTQFELEDVVAGDESDYDRVRSICEWVRGRWEHNGDNEPKKSDPISILEEAATGKRFRCVEYAIVVAGALEAVGIPARVLALKTEDVETRPRGAGHVVAEAWLAGKSKWIMIDGQFDVIPTLDGEPLNAVELQRALAAKKKGLDVDSLSGTKADAWFRWVAPYLYHFDTALDRRHGVARSPGALMLVPIGAKNPTVFQGKHPISNMTYTSSVPAFYANPGA